MLKPREVKSMAQQAWNQQNLELALRVCQVITEGDLYLNYPTGYGHDPKVVTVQWGDKPCQAKCENLVPEGSHAWWLQGIGVWHLYCPTPEAVLKQIQDRPATLPLEDGKHD